METKMPTFPFEGAFEEILINSESYVDAVFSCLESEFLVMPKGTGFVEYPVFERGYEALKASTQGFSRVEPSNMLAGILKEPISLVVLRSMLGFTPPEWGYVATQRTGVVVSQGFVRSLDRKVRMTPETPINLTGVTRERLQALVDTACQLLSQGAPKIEAYQLHRLDKADTKVGIEGFDQIPDFIVPSEFNPQVIIEAKITEDDGTARDKVTRIQHLVSLSKRSQENTPKYEVVACIGGRGFGVRREDMKRLILWTRGKVFTVKTLDRLVEYTRLREFRTK